MRKAGGLRDLRAHFSIVCFAQSPHQAQTKKHKPKDLRHRNRSNDDTTVNKSWQLSLSETLNPCPKAAQKLSLSPTAAEKKTPDKLCKPLTSTPKY